MKWGLVAITLVVQASSWVQLSNGLQFQDLSSALLSSNSSTEQVIFLDLDTYSLFTFGNHLNVILACLNSTLSVSAPVVVSAFMTVQLLACRVISSLKAPAVITVLGAVLIEDSSVRDLTSRAILLYGSLSLRTSAFLSNSNSLVTALLFGVSLSIQHCQFVNNSSPLGAVFLFSLGYSQKLSATNITVRSSEFSGNKAALGGSVLYLNVLQTLSLSPSQQSESRSVTVSDCRFAGNSNIVMLISSNAYLPSVYRNNTFTSTRTAFVIRRLSADLSIENSSFEVSDFLVYLTALWAQLTVLEAVVTGLSAGPAITIIHTFGLSKGLARISGLTVLAPTTLTQVDYSSIIGCRNAVVLVERIVVRDGVARVGLGGSYSFCTVKIRDVFVQNVTCTSALIGALYSSVDARDLFMVNVTLTWGGFVSFYHSTATVRNLTADTGSAGYYLDPVPFYTVLVTYDSNVTLTDCTLVMPAIPNSPALYLWRSSVFVANLTFTALYARLVSAIDGSVGVIENVTISDYQAENLASVFGSSLDLQYITIEHGRVEVSLLSVLSGSAVTAHNVRLLTGRLQSLVASSHSKVRLDSWELPAFTADALFIRIVNSNIKVTNVTLVDSSFDLAELYSSQVALSYVALSNIQIRRRFITLTNSSLSLQSCSLLNLKATTDTPLCRASKGSTLALHFTRIDSLWSLDQRLMLFSQSSLVLSHSSLSQCNATFIAGVNSRLRVDSSNVSESGLWRSRGKVTAGFADCSNCKVQFRASQFVNISGASGAVLSIVSSSLVIEDCLFIAGVAREGGFVYALNSNVSIEQSAFEEGQATHGGALSFVCTKEGNCSCNITASNFTQNSAVEGGAVYWTQVRPVYTSVMEANNQAVYGPFEASLPSHITLLNTNQSILLGVAGAIVHESILIGLFDDVGQLVKTASSYVVELISQHIAGATYLIAQSGIANFSGVIIQTVPGQTANITAYSRSIAQLSPNSSGAQISFSYETRLCVLGEVTTPSGCFLCPKYTFSLNPTDTLCTNCPHYASCPGGSTLLLDPGYWRASSLSEDVLQCPIPEACIGGANSSCAQGYEGALCARCSPGRYNDGLTHCIVCESLSVRIVRSILLFAAALALYMFLLLNPKDNVTVSLKILVEFLHALLILPLINVDWTHLLLGYFGFNEMLLSFGLASLSLQCVLEDNSLPHIYAQAIVASASLLVLAICLFLVIAFRQKNRTRRNVQSEVLRCFCIAVWLLQPYLLKSSLPLLYCRPVAGRWRLLEDVGKQCSEQAVWSYALALPLTLLHIAGLPCLLCALLHKKTNLAAQNSMRFFSIGYPVRFQYNSVLDNLRTTFFFVLLICLSAVEPSIQMISGFGFLYICLHRHMQQPSYIETAHSTAKGFSLLLQAYLCAFALYFSPSLGADSRALQGLGGLLLALIVGFIVTMVLLMIRQWRAQAGGVVSQVPASLSGTFPEASPFVPPPSCASQSIQSCDPWTVVLDFNAPFPIR